MPFLVSTYRTSSTTGHIIASISNWCCRRQPPKLASVGWLDTKLTQIALLLSVPRRLLLVVTTVAAVASGEPDPPHRYVSYSVVGGCLACLSRVYRCDHVVSVTCSISCVRLVIFYFHSLNRIHHNIGLASLAGSWLTDKRGCTGGQCFQFRKPPTLFLVDSRFSPR